MDAVAFFLLAVAMTLIVVGLSRLLAWFLDRREHQLRSNARALQMVTAARLQYRLRLCLSCGESFTAAAFCAPCLIDDMQPVGGAL